MRFSQKILLLVALFTILNVLFISCSDDNATDSKSSVPALTTTAVTSVTNSTAESGGNIASDGGAPVIARGVCWSTSETPTLGDNITSDGTGTGSFTSSMEGLAYNTTYYVRAYATNNTGTGYGNTVSFTTAVPLLTTTAVSVITHSTAESGGNITSDGGTPVITRGLCWSTGETPTLSDNITSDGTGTGSFASSMEGLAHNTTYYVRAYATNNTGTGYGNTVTFTTLDSAYMLTDIDGNVYQAVSIGTQIWMVENLKTEHYRNGDALWKAYDNEMWVDLTNTGACCTYEDNSSNVPDYGRLYNWAAVNDSRGLAPEGWHIPSKAEWETLVHFLGGVSVAGGKMKETGSEYWQSPNTGATNESGFSGRGGGIRVCYNGVFVGLRERAEFWSSTEMPDSNAVAILLFWSYERMEYYNSTCQGGGKSIRCVKDQP